MTTHSGDENSHSNSPPNPSNPSDDDLLAVLRAGQDAIDPAPENLVEVAMRALTWDTEFAALIAASPVEEAVLVRSADTSEVQTVDLVFEIDGSVLEVAIEPDDEAGSYRLDGLVHPRCDRVRIVKPSGPQQSIECDSFGRFDATGVQEPFALAFELADGRLVRTELIDLP